jgi:hypothetical protein
MKNEELLIIQYTSRHVDIMHVGESNKHFKTLAFNTEQRILVQCCLFHMLLAPADDSLCQ